MSDRLAIRAYDPLNEEEREQLLYTPCDECRDFDEFVELCEWADEYGKNALARLYGHCLRRKYNVFVIYLKRTYPPRKLTGWF